VPVRPGALRSEFSQRRLGPTALSRRLVTNFFAPGWREHVEAIADGNRLVITTENVTEMGRSRYEFVFRKE